MGMEFVYIKDDRELKEYLTALERKTCWLSYISGGDQLTLEIGTKISRGKEMVGEYRLLTQDVIWELSSGAVLLFSRESLPNEEELRILKDISIESIEIDEAYKVTFKLERNLELVLYSWRDGDLWDLWNINEDNILTLTTEDNITRAYISPSNLPNYLRRKDE